MKKAFLTIAICFMLAGCLQFEQSLTFRKDGSMTVTMTYGVPIAYLPVFEAGHQAIAKWQSQQANSAPPNWFMNEKAVRTFFNHPEDGVTLLQYKTFERDGKKFAEIVIDAQNAAKACELGYFGDMKLTEENGRHRLAMNFPPPKNIPPEQIAELRERCGDLSITVTIITPEAITETNGLKRRSREAVWRFSTDGRGIDIFREFASPVIAW